MKRLLLLLTLMRSTSSLFAQSTTHTWASSCGASCDIISAEAKNDHACGGNHDLQYQVRNNTGETLDVAMFVEKEGGGWKTLGLSTGLGGGRSTGNFWGCGLTGRYLFFYRPAGSSAYIPSESEMNQKMGGHSVSVTQTAASRVITTAAKPAVVNRAAMDAAKPANENLTRVARPVTANGETQAQQQANAYLNDAAQNPDNSIRQAKDLSLARLNAIASGNQAQAQQIQQQQNKAQTQATSDLVDAVGAFLTRPRTTPSYNPSYSSSNEGISMNSSSFTNHYKEDSQIKAKLRENTVKFPGKYDKYNFPVGNSDLVVNGEKQSLSPDELYARGCLANIENMYVGFPDALIWFTKAADAGSVRAMVRLADEYKAKKMYDAAIERCQQALSNPKITEFTNEQFLPLISYGDKNKVPFTNFRDNIIAVLGDSYYEGYRDKKSSNFAQAVIYLTQLDAQNPSAACRYYIGVMNEFGDLTMVKNTAVVLDWFEKAHELDPKCDLITRNIKAFKNRR